MNEYGIPESWYSWLRPLLGSLLGAMITLDLSSLPLTFLYPPSIPPTPFVPFFVIFLFYLKFTVLFLGYSSLDMLLWPGIKPLAYWAFTWLAKALFVTQNFFQCCSILADGLYPDNCYLLQHGYLACSMPDVLYSILIFLYGFPMHHLIVECIARGKRNQPHQAYGL